MILRHVIDAPTGTVHIGPMVMPERTPHTRLRAVCGTPCIWDGRYIREVPERELLVQATCRRCIPIEVDRRRRANRRAINAMTPIPYPDSGAR